MAFRFLPWALALALAAPAAALADTPPFDLAGPVLEVTVTHAQVTLPISEVPNLAAGDQLSIRADLPATQSVRYLLVVAFLRGAANPPPKTWFYRSDTWNPKARDGLKVTVPEGAQQAVVFLAPQTGGDFRTLVDAVRGRPGAFVRASQDLVQASLDRSRLDAFLAALRRQDPADPERLKTVSPLLARSLTIKLNTDCFDKLPELQAACLMEGREALVLNDGHSTSIVEALTSGNPAQLATELSATAQAGFGYYSPYIGAAMDIARILDSLHTAQYQYIPALAQLRDERVALVLNTPPSFHNPLSVLVSALPAVEAAQAPPLRPVDPSAAYCVQRPGLVLPVEGAPLAYSTRFAHDMVLRLTDQAGKRVDLPARADAEQGGFVVDQTGLDPARLGGVVEGRLAGMWGFAPFEGPSFRLENGRAPWRLAGDDPGAVVAGRDDQVLLEGSAGACVESVQLRQASGDAQSLDWKAEPGGQLNVSVPLAGAPPGPLTLLVKRYGAGAPESIALQAFSQAGHLSSFAFHAGDAGGELKGSRLDQVASLVLAGTEFKPGPLASSGGEDTLQLAAGEPAGLARLAPGAVEQAKILLKDGRTARLKVVVAPPRPHIALIGKSTQAPVAKAAGAIRLGGPDELAEGGQLTFSVRATAPTTFSGHETIEVATLDGGASASLASGNGLIIEDPKVAVASLDPAKALGTSAYGRLRFRLVQDGNPGDWLPLATLVRLPAIRGLKCAQGGGCELLGVRLFLIDAIADNPAFDHPVQVPEGYPGETLRAPRPQDGRLYLKLHDDPGVISQLTIAERPKALSAAKPE